MNVCEYSGIEEKMLKKKFEKKFEKNFETKKKSNFFWIFSTFTSVKSPASRKENVRFPDSPDFVNFPVFRTGRDVW